MHDTSAMDTSFGPSSQGQTQSKRDGRAGGGKMIPATAMMIKRAAEHKKSEGDDFIINGEPVQQVKLVGQVQVVKETQTNCIYTLNDSSGALVEVKRWIGTDDGVKEQNVRADVREGVYCCVIGTLRSMEDSAYINCYVISPLKCMNEITRHLLEVSYVHLAITRAHYSSESMQVDPTHHGGGNVPSAPSAAQIHADLTAIQKDVFEVLRGCQKQLGIHIDDIISRLASKYSRAGIKEALEHLCSEGLAYNSSDDDHFQSTE